jgi:hypothetical protein
VLAAQPVNRLEKSLLSTLGTGVTEWRSQGPLRIEGTILTEGTTCMTEIESEIGEPEMSEADRQTTEQLLPIDQWLAIRKKAGSTIDPETAEVMWVYAQTLDPYGVHPNLPEDCQSIGREYFARSPESDVWVWFVDLSCETRERLWNLPKASLAFTAGLF